MADTKISALPSATTPLAGAEVLPIVQSGTTDKVSVSNLTSGRTIDFAGAYATNATAATFRGYSIGGANTATEFGFLKMEVSTGVMRLAAGFTGWGGQLALSTNGVDRITVSSAGDATLNTGNLIQGTAAKGVNFTANTPAAGMTSRLLNWYEEGTWTPTPVGITVVSGTPVYTGKYTRIGRQVTIDIAMTNLSGTITIAAGNSFGSLPFTSATTSWGVYGDPGNAAKGGFCTVSGASVYFATANTYTDYFSLTVTYSV